MIDPAIPLAASPGPAPLNPVQTLAGIGQLRAQQQEGAIRDQQLTMNQRQMDAATRAEVEDQRLRALFAKGVPSAGDLYSTVGPVRGNEILKGLAAFRGEQLKTSKEIRDTVGSMAGGILALPPSMQEDAYAMARQGLLTRGVNPEDVPEQFPGVDGLKQIQAWAMSAKDQVDAAAPKLTNVPPGGVVIDAKNPGAGPVYTAPEKVTPPGGFELSPGQVRFDATGKQIASVPATPPQGPQPGWQWVVRDGKETYTNRVKEGDTPQNVRVKSTEDERKMAGFYGQMSDAITILDELESSLTQQELYQIQTLPQEGLIGMANRGELSENAKRYLRAFEQFTESRLRPVSGAAINDAEYARDRRTYAKQYAETPKLAADRKRARLSALESLRKRAGVAIDDAAQTPKADATKSAPPTVGSIVIFQGKRYTVKSITNGQAELEAVP